MAIRSHGKRVIYPRLRAWARPTGPRTFGSVSSRVLTVGLLGSYNPESDPHVTSGQGRSDVTTCPSHYGRIQIKDPDIPKSWTPNYRMFDGATCPVAPGPCSPHWRSPDVVMWLVMRDVANKQSLT
jgi:hypothetical protein